MYRRTLAGGLLSQGLFILCFCRFTSKGSSRQNGLSHHLAVEMSGARGTITAFARVLVSEPYQPLGHFHARHVGLGCRLSIRGVSGNSPNYHPSLARTGGLHRSLSACQSRDFKNLVLMVYAIRYSPFS